LALLNRATSDERRGTREFRILYLSFSLCAFLITASVAGAQARRGIDLDQLQITSLGLAYGHIRPSQVVPTSLVAIEADYGNIARQWRLVFNASFWQSHFEDDVVRAFADSLHKSLSNPSASVLVSPIRIYDAAFGGDVRFTPEYPGEIKPFVGLGLAAHVVNAEGPLINGTFVERALDDIAAGLYVTGGFSLKLQRHFGVEAAARADLLSGFRSTQVRAGLAYYFGHVRPATPEPEDNRNP
jgi:hypothetical protein